MNIENVHERVQANIMGLRHKHYGFMVEMGDWCRSMMTGEGQEAELRKIRKGDSEESIRARLDVTVPRTPECLSPAETIYRKTFRVDGIKDNYEGDPEAVQAVKEKMRGFYGGAGVQAYLQDHQLFHEFYDPNAWGLMEFEVERNEEKTITDVKVYPVEISSSEAVDYVYERGVPVYLCVLRQRTELVNGTEQKMDTFTAYYRGGAVEYRESAEPQTDAVYTLQNEGQKKRVFEVRVYANGTECFMAAKFGAYRCGIVDDPSVKAPPYFPARHVLLRVLRGGSLKDVCKWKHVYPKAYGIDFDCDYVDPNTHASCDGEGWLGGNESHTCPGCGGTGSMLHSSEMGIALFRHSMAAEKSEIILPSQFIHYDRAPLEQTEWISKDLTTDQQLVLLTMFNTQQEQAVTVPTTATEQLLNWENVNNEVWTFASHTSFLSEMFTTACAALLEADVTYNHSYPKNLGLEPLDSLINKYKSSTDAGLAGIVSETIYCEILTKQLSDDPITVERFRALQDHRPWRDKTPDLALMIAQSRSPQDPKRVKFENWGEISSEVDRMYPLFASYDFNRQSAIINEIAQRIAGEVVPLVDASSFVDFGNEAAGEEVSDTEPIIETQPDPVNA